jgi:hypothetical protein
LDMSLTRELSLLDEVRRDIRVRLSAIGPGRREYGVWLKVAVRKSPLSSEGRSVVP